ncbi:uncharacterized protein GJ701_009694 [Geothlypis trichas]
MQKATWGKKRRLTPGLSMLATFLIASRGSSVQEVQSRPDALSGFLLQWDHVGCRETEKENCFFRENELDQALTVYMQHSCGQMLPVTVLLLELSRGWCLSMKERAVLSVGAPDTFTPGPVCHLLSILRGHTGTLLFPAKAMFTWDVETAVCKEWGSTGGMPGGALDCEEQLKGLWLPSPLSLQHCCSGFPEALPASPFSPCTETRSQLPDAQTAGCCAAQGDKSLSRMSAQGTPKKKLGSRSKMCRAKDNLLRSLWWRRCQCIGAHPAVTVQALGARRRHQQIKQHPMSLPLSAEFLFSCSQRRKKGGNSVFSSQPYS